MITKYFNADLDKGSPVQKDFDRVVNYDDEGNEFITYVEVDYAKIVQSHGSVGDWSLNALLKAGINPQFGIHTGNPTRIEGLGDLDAFSQVADSILSEIEEK